jgi:Bacterial PH domain
MVAANRVLMSTMEKVLGPGERVQLVTREHGIVLIPAFARAAVAVAGIGALAVIVSRAAGLGPLRVVLAIAAGVLAAYVLARLSRRVHRWQARRLVVTDRRLILLAGGLSRRMAALPLDSIQCIEVRCPGAGRMLHYGSLVVTSGDRRGPLFGLRRLPDPDLLMALVLGLDEHIPAVRRAGSSGAPVSGRPVAAPR